MAENTLKKLSEAAGKHIGAAVRPELLDDGNYSGLLEQEYNILTAENAMKFAYLCPQKGSYDFSMSDRFMEFAEASSSKVRGHTLVWGESVPGWLSKGMSGKETVLEVLEKHIAEVAGRYAGRVLAWDAVNEAVGDDGLMKENFWMKHIGPDYVEKTFAAAHAADPAAKLFYNEYGLENRGRKFNAVFEFLKKLLRKGVPVHGVGMQMHIDSCSPPAPGDLSSVIGSFASLGLEVHITEMDVRIADGTGEQALEQQGTVYRDVLAECLGFSNCTAVLTWGFTDRYSWVPSFFKGYGRALPFDGDFNRKPAYGGISEGLERILKK